MASQVFNTVSGTSGATDERIEKTSAVSYAAADAATATRQTQVTEMYVGNYFSTSWYLDQTFLAFNTSALAAATITSWTLELYLASVGRNIDTHLQEIYASAWGGDTVVAGDWVAAASLGTRLAYFDTTGATSGAYKSFTIEDSGAAINKSGITGFVLTTDTYRLATDPQSAGNSQIDWYGADFGPNTYPPKLTVNYTAGFVGMLVTRKVG